MAAPTFPPLAPSLAPFRPRWARFGFLALALPLLAGCSSVYYGTLEKFGVQKREILVDRVESAREAQDDAKQQFKTTLQRFNEITGHDGGELERRYEALKSEFDRAESQANAVRRRVDAIEEVAREMFSEWETELASYTDRSLRDASSRQLRETRERYAELIGVMRRATVRMDPVLAAFRDQVLFLKHNLNARAIASLGDTGRGLRREIDDLIVQMERSIAEADKFVRELGR